jgi:ribonuclease HI
MGKSRFYVVWKGRRPGIYPSWSECEAQGKGYEGAEYKAFESAAEARAALAAGYERYRGRPASQGKWKRGRSKPRIPSLCADAACSGSPGWLEFRVVATETGQQLLKAGPYAEGTNNVGEFLAIVEALRWLQKQRLPWPIYSDSENAIGWVQRRKCNTKLERTTANRKLFDLIARAEADLPALLSAGGGPQPTILKWDTVAWGENPADFGRK